MKRKGKISRVITEQDVIVSEPITEVKMEPNRTQFIVTRVIVSLKEELREMLGFHKVAADTATYER